MSGEHGEVEGEGDDYADEVEQGDDDEGEEDDGGDEVGELHYIYQPFRNLPSNSI